MVRTITNICLAWGRLTAVINLRSRGDYDYVKSYS